MNRTFKLSRCVRLYQINKILQAIQTYCINIKYLFFQINHLDYDTDITLKELREKRGYTYEDEITCSKACLQNYEEKVDIIYISRFAIITITIIIITRYKTILRVFIETVYLTTYFLFYL